MASEQVEIADGIASIRVAGTLGGTASAGLQKQIGEAIKSHGRLRILLRAEDFTGWEAGVDWSDLSFQVFQDAIDPHIERMAVVVDTPWQDAVLVFLGSGLRPFPIECFAPSQLARARAWLTAA